MAVFMKLMGTRKWEGLGGNVFGFKHYNFMDYIAWKNRLLVLSPLVSSNAVLCSVLLCLLSFKWESLKKCLLRRS